MIIRRISTGFSLREHRLLRFAEMGGNPPPEAPREAPQEIPSFNPDKAEEVETKMAQMDAAADLIEEKLKQDEEMQALYAKLDVVEKPEEAQQVVQEITQKQVQQLEQKTSAAMNKVATVRMAGMEMEVEYQTPEELAKLFAAIRETAEQSRRDAADTLS